MMMFNKKRVSVIAAACLGLALAFTACGSKDSTEEANSEAVFPEGYSIAGVDVSGKTATEAKDLLTAAASEYSIDVTVNGRDFEITSADLSVALNDSFDFNAALAAVAEETEYDCSEVYTSIDEVDMFGMLRNRYVNLLTDEVNAEAQPEAEESTEPSAAEQELLVAQATNQPTAAYDKEAGCFVARDGIDCEMLDYEAVVPDILKAIHAGEKAVSVDVKQVSATAIMAADSEYAAKVIASANEYLGIALTIHFELEGYDPSDEVISPKEIASWLLVDVASNSVAVSEESLSEFCADVAKKHDKAKYQSSTFHTSASGDIQIQVPVTGTTVDANKLFEDIVAALEKKQASTINAVFVEVQGTAKPVEDFGGTYAEIDLTNQKVYLYKDGVCLLNGVTCVTGSVAQGWRTPTGVYTMFTHERDRYLNGPTWHCWVNYFCAFNGGIGFHDAKWRIAWGPEEYLFNGSKGCINMYYGDAKILYDNTYVGYKVVVYGGLTSITKQDQPFTGTTSYDVKDNAGSFPLDVAWKGSPEVTYSSSNDAVASVDGNGYVYVNGVGSCTINVHTSEYNQYNEGNYSVTINVGESHSAASVSGTATSASVENTNGLTATSTVSASSTSGAALSYSLESNAHPDWVDATVNPTTGVVTFTAKGNAAANEQTVTVRVKVSSAQTDSYYAAEGYVDVNVTLTAPVTPLTP